MRRNFQGYTTDVSDALIAFGASAIGEFSHGFAQSARDTLEWSQHIERGESPAVRGIVTTPEDRMRAEAIERLMCDLNVNVAEIAARHGLDAAVFSDLGERMAPAIAAGIASLNGAHVTVPAEQRLFLRNVAAAFDTHFVSAPNRHARAV
jgi:oxygen-independent coproporphyrinogen-3 oxidase